LVSAQNIDGVAMSDLAKELEVYKNALPLLANEEGKYVLVGDGEVSGLFSAYADALQAGYEKFGIKPFLVKQISGQEQIAYFSRDFSAPCQV
jgi:hypothetical protein